MLEGRPLLSACNPERGVLMTKSYLPSNKESPESEPRLCGVQVAVSVACAPASRKSMHTHESVM